ncbi:receptor-like protein 7, partial [Solanum stenotomum]|uniref:receptor-like protein 7 n=1 Tax=Solanum stenotomum TaxID=172797 RepID=UPI0020D03552
ECFSSSFDHHLCSPTEASALLQFKQSFQISDYYDFLCDTSFPKTKSWNESRDCCSWDGVTCDLLNGHVIGLDLSCSQLRGSIHPNSSLFQLHHLQTLNLDNNYFNPSSIPHTIGRLRNLRHLKLSGFDGKIPTEISYLSNLVSLDLSYSYDLQLDERTFETMLHNFTNLELLALPLGDTSSHIPVSIHPNSSLFQLNHLHTLNLVNNYFYPSSSIPHNIGRLRNLRHLVLSGFDGKIPTEISYLSNLVSLDLSYSYDLQLDERTFETMLHNFTNLELLALPLGDMSSPIPVSIHPNSSLFQLHHLQTLNLDNNYFNPSSIPHTIGRLRNLRHLKLSGFDGKIPTEISYLSNLVSLHLFGNGLQHDERAFEAMFQNLTNLEVLSLFDVNISSPIPVNISSSLTELDISYTGISGSIPDSIGTLKSLNILSLQQCQFSGSIPDSIGNLTQIMRLDLSYNHFTGHIPSTISNLQELRYLYLSHNSFSGEIPDVFSNLQELHILYLDHNNFIGPFPASILNLTRLEYLDMSSNSLSGPLPSNPSMLQNLTYVDLSYNSLNGTIPSWVFSLPLLPSLSLQHNRFRGLADEVIKTNPTLKELHLSNNQLSGSFPQSLVNLTNLETLGISSNNITIDEGMNITFLSLSSLFLSSCQLKDFPHFLRNVKTLVYLDISNNKIHGQIPNWFSGMRWDSLQFLNLSHNSLTGHLPQFHYYNLQYLDLKFNSLQGPLPPSICDMSSLILLDLSRNNFSNAIPSCLGSIANLTVLDLRRNNFTGSLPPLCAHNTSLSTIVVNGNRFEGPVPVSLLKCDSLEVLDVGNNAINDAFPAWLGTLQELQVLILKSNKFHGPISTCQTKFCFPKLRIFDLSRNDFSGSLPAKVFGNFKAMIKLDDEDTREIRYMKSMSNLPFVTSYEDSVSLVIKGQDIELERISTITTTIDLSRNHFEGVIPKTLKDLSSLWLLNLSHNNLIGHIPMELGQLNTLEALDLSWNRLTGKIPQELTRMNFLAFLNLSQNHLVGSIPQGQQFNTFANDSYGDNLDLCGPPLSKQCETSDSSHVPQSLESEEEGETYFFSGFTWESVVIGYSFGLVVGTVMWSLMFKYRKPKWFVEFFDGLMPHKRRRQKKRAQRRRT